MSIDNVKFDQRSDDVRSGTKAKAHHGQLQAYNSLVVYGCETSKGTVTHGNSRGWGSTIKPPGTGNPGSGGQTGNKTSVGGFSLNECFGF